MCLEMTSFVPESHNMAVGAEAGEADTVAQCYDISTKHEGRLSNVLLVRTVLGWQ